MSSSRKMHMRKLGLSILAVGSMALAAVFCAPASAAPVTLSSGNSVATIDSVSGNVSSVKVDGVTQLINQSLYFAIPSLDGGTPQSLSTLTQISESSTANTMSLVYSGPGFNATLDYLLSAGNAASSSGQLSSLLFLQTPTIASPNVTMSVYQYDDMTLGGSTNNTVVVNPTLNNVSQSQNGGPATATLQPLNQYQEFEVGLSPTVFNSLSHPVTLNNNAGPVSGNVEFAVENDTTISFLNGPTVSALETFNPGVPVPAAAWMGLTTLVGIGAVSAIRRKIARA